MSKKTKKILYFIPIILLTLFITLLVLHEKLEIKNTRNNKENIIENINYETIEDNKTPMKYKKQYTFNIKTISNETSLNFLVKHHYTEVYINNELVYSMNINKNNLIKTPYKYWVNIPLNNNDINSEVKIILTPINKIISNNDIEIEIISKYDLLINNLYKSISTIILSIINITIGLFILLTHYIKKNNKYIPIFNIVLGLLLLSNNKLILLILPKLNIILYFLSIILLILTIILFIPIIKDITNNIYKKILTTTIIIDVIMIYLLKINTLFTITTLTIYIVHNYIKKLNNKKSV